MDGNYAITHLKASQENLDLVQETCGFLQATHMTSGITTGPAIEMAARAKIDMSFMPSNKKEKLKDLVSPINEELNRWYRICDCIVRPAWTPQATVDVRASISAMLEESSMSSLERFQLACKLCCHDHLSTLCNQLVPKNAALLKAKSPLSFLWYRYYTKTSSCTGFLALKFYCNKGLVLALQEYNEAAVEIFIDRVHPDTVSKTIEMALVEGPLKSLDTSFSPTMTCTLFARLDASQQIRYKGAFATLLLNALLRWPNQGRFLEAAEALMPFINQEQCLCVMTGIATRVVDRYSGFDYRVLYVQFSQLMAQHHGSLCEFLRPGGNKSLDTLLNMEVPVVHFVLSNFPIDLQEELLLEPGGNDFCEALLFRQHFGRLEVFIRGLAMHSVDLLIRLKTTFMAKFDYNQELGKWKALKRNTYLKRKTTVKWSVLRSPFLLMMDRIIAEKRTPIDALRNVMTRLSSQLTTA